MIHRLTYLFIVGGLVLPAIIVLLASCGSSTSKTENGVELYLREPADGITCIVADGVGTVAIDCNWPPSR